MILLTVTCAVILSACNLVSAQIPAPTVIDLSVEQPDLSVLGGSTLDKTGWKIEGGDVNGDGSREVIVLLAGSSPYGRQGSGSIVILSANQARSGTVDLAETSGIATIAGVSHGAAHDGSLACGDINGDGYDDIVWGIPWRTPYRHCDVDGTAFIVYGRQVFPDTLDLEDPTAGATLVLSPLCGDGHLGLFAAAVGDIDGDGFQDVALAATNLAPSGEVYVLYGGTVMPQTIDLSGDPGAQGFIRILGYRLGEGIGRALAFGDVDNDCYDDLLIGSPGDFYGYLNGKARLLYGGEALPDTIELENYSGRATTFLPKPDPVAESHLGEALAIGDVNGDGFSDVILGARGADTFDFSGAGEAYIVYGANEMPTTLNVTAPSHPITHLLGRGDYAGYGYALCTGDLTGDRRDEVVILKDSVYDPRMSQNQVFIYYGTPAQPDSVFLPTDTSMSRVISAVYDVDSQFGYGLDIDDYNEDGVRDLLIGAYRADPKGRRASGKVIAIDGQRLVRWQSAPVNSPSLRLIPNPFTQWTTVTYTLQETSPVTMDVFDVRGRRIRRLMSSASPAGTYTLEWDGRNAGGTMLPSGVYFLVLRTDYALHTQKFIIIR